MQTLDNFLIKYQQLEGRRKHAITMLESVKTNKLTLERKLLRLSHIEEFLVSLGNELHQHCKGVLEKVVNACLSETFPDTDYRIEIDFVHKRGTMECVVNLCKSDIKLSGFDFDMGGGMVDLISLLIRFIIWQISQKKSIGFFVLDEPLKFISDSYLPACVRFLESFIEKLDVQVIIISHEADLINMAKNVINLDN